MTGPEQHAATVRSFFPWSIGNPPEPDPSTPWPNRNLAEAALDELVALALEAERLAGRADELEREAEKCRREERMAVHDAQKLERRAEAAEARADELQERLYAIENMPPDGYLAINVEAMRPSDELEQARREADQLRAALRRIADRYCLHAKGDVREASVCLDKPVDQWCSVCVARAALAGVQAEEQTTWGPDHPSYDEMGQ